MLRTLYSVMLKTRMLEEQVLALLRAGRIPGVPVPILGGEATEVGACIGLQPDDSFASSQPKLATHVVSDTPLERVFAQLLNPQKTTSPARSHPSAESLRVIPQSATVAAQFDIAAGVALAYRQLDKPNVVVALADDGLAALGFWHEAATLASRTPSSDCLHGGELRPVAPQRRRRRRVRRRLARSRRGLRHSRASRSMATTSSPSGASPRSRFIAPAAAPDPR